MYKTSFVFGLTCYQVKTSVQFVVQSVVRTLSEPRRRIYESLSNVPVTSYPDTTSKEKRKFHVVRIVVDLMFLHYDTFDLWYIVRVF